ncbi:MAG TPA: hypothetical protein VFH77_00325 [Streptomyces sp.]|jgi:hypothetical protein|nr:hypothetical protein [Streptomyces sp.]
MPQTLAVLRTSARDLLDWVRRRPRPGAATARHTIRHSSDVRMAVLALAVPELIAEGLMDVALPPDGRAVHILWMTLLALAVLSFLVSLARRPHLVGDRRVVLQAGPLGTVQVPPAAVSAVRTELRATKGLGVRAVPDDDRAVACSLGGTTQLVLELTEPVTVPVGGRGRRGRQVEALRVYFAADDPPAAARQVRASARTSAAEATRG